MKKLLLILTITLLSCTNKHKKLIGDYIRTNYSGSYEPISFEIDSIIDITDSILIIDRNELYNEIKFNTIIINTLVIDIDELKDFDDDYNALNSMEQYHKLNELLNIQHRSLDSLNSVINKLPKTLIGWKVDHIFKMNNIEYQHLFIINKEKTKIIEYDR